MQRYCFKQKRYGFGAAPSSWEGWAATALYSACVLLIALWRASGLAPVLALALIAGTTIIFCAICWRTAEGGWRWRWGEHD